MTDIRVTCLLDRYWNPVTREYEGTEYTGVLVGTSVQDDSGKLSPVGIVMLYDSTFHSVPMEFIRKS